MLLFTITKRSPLPVNTLLTPASPAVRYTAMQESATAGQAELADGTKVFAGFQTRASAADLALSDLIYPGRLELPFICSQEGTFEFGEDVVAEGTDYLSADVTVGIAANSPLKTPCSFVGGKFALGATGQICEFMLVETGITPEVAGNVRARFRRMAAWVKPA